MKILSGKEVSQEWRKKIASGAEVFHKKVGRRPGLAVILVGENPASHVYVSHKAKACAEVGIQSFEFRFPADLPKETLHTKIEELNQSPDVDGILVQLPLPPSLDEKEVLSWILPQKDPDGLTIVNQGLCLADSARIWPCTPLGVIKILEFYNIPIAGQRAVVVGRSQIVGKPMHLLLQNHNATVTVCHSKTQDLEAYTREADLVVVAAGKPRFLGKSAFKKNAIVIDVGMHRLENGKLCGDIRLEELEDHAAAATPVPGGVGPMTITMLMHNTLDLANQRLNLSSHP